MPELPEVTTIVNDLNKSILGKKIVSIWTDRKSTVKSPKSFSLFEKDIIGKKIENLKRRGKFLVFGLSGGVSLILHLRMSGHLLYQEKIKGSFTDVRFQRFFWDFKDKTRLVLSDVRKFATIDLIKTVELANFPPIQKLGFEPLENSFSLDKLQMKISKKPTILKSLLLDQTIVTGIGNIYADEILWHSGLNPTRKANTLKPQEIKKLHVNIKKVLLLGVKSLGSSDRDYFRPDGTKGNFQNLRKAYKKTGAKCSKNDGGTIKRIIIGQRSTHYCPVHQI